MASTQVQGCTDELACNYDSDALEDDDSCFYAEENYDCDGNCTAEVDCAGECGGVSVEDECSICGGDGPEANFDCESNCLESVGADCLGVCGGDAQTDVCGNCNASNDICSFFQLLDLNTTSPSYGSLVGPQTYSGEIRLFYFSENET